MIDVRGELLGLAAGAGDEVGDHVLRDTIAPLVIQTLDAELPGLDDEAVHLLDRHLGGDVEIEALRTQVSKLLANKFNT